MEVLYPHCAGLDVHKETVVACQRHMVNGAIKVEVRTFGTTTKDLVALWEWLATRGCTHIAMEAPGVYWKPVWQVLRDGDFALVLANAGHVKNVRGHKTDVNDATWLADLMAHGLIRGSFVPPRPRNCAACCAPASNWFANEAAMSSTFRRRWRMPTSSSTRSSRTSSGFPVARWSRR